MLAACLTPVSVWREFSKKQSDCKENAVNLTTGIVINSVKINIIRIMTIFVILFFEMKIRVILFIFIKIFFLIS